MVDKDDANAEADKSAERREKLKALRKKQQEQGGAKTPAVRADGQKRQGLARAGQGGEGGGKDRPKLRKLMEQRKRQNAGGDSDSGGTGAQGGGVLRKILAGKKKKAGKGGFDLDKFPRLVDGGRGKKGGEGVTVTASSSLSEITEERKKLQNRVDALKKATQKTLNDLQKVEALEKDASGTSAGSDK